jgi:hypothetical protein
MEYVIAGDFEIDGAWSVPYLHNFRLPPSAQIDFNVVVEELRQFYAQHASKDPSIIEEIEQGLLECFPTEETGERTMILHDSYPYEKYGFFSDIYATEPMEIKYFEIKPPKYPKQFSMTHCVMAAFHPLYNNHKMRWIPDNSEELAIAEALKFESETSKPATFRPKIRKIRKSGAPYVFPKISNQAKINTDYTINTLNNINRWMYDRNFVGFIDFTGFSNMRTTGHSNSKKEIDFSDNPPQTLPCVHDEEIMNNVKLHGLYGAKRNDLVRAYYTNPIQTDDKKHCIYYILVFFALTPEKSISPALPVNETASLKVIIENLNKFHSKTVYPKLVLTPPKTTILVSFIAHNLHIVKLYSQSKSDSVADKNTEVFMINDYFLGPPHILTSKCELVTDRKVINSFSDIIPNIHYVERSLFAIENWPALKAVFFPTSSEPVYILHYNPTFHPAPHLSISPAYYSVSRDSVRAYTKLEE